MNGEEVASQIARMDAELQHLKSVMEKTQAMAIEEAAESKGYVKGALKSFNADLVSTCTEWDRRAKRVERALWGESGANGLAGDMRVLKLSLRATWAVLVLVAPALFYYFTQ